MSFAFTEKQRAFIDEYLIDLNATQAAIRAGYSADTAAQIGYENLRKPEIAQAIGIALAERAQRTQITQDYVLNAVVETIERCRQKSEFDPQSVLKGAKLLGDHIGTFKERVELTGKDGKPIEISDAKAALLRGLVPDASGSGTDQANK
jgi:phage terminase small subunit